MVKPVDHGLLPIKWQGLCAEFPSLGVLNQVFSLRQSFFPKRVFNLADLVGDGLWALFPDGVVDQGDLGLQGPIQRLAMPHRGVPFHPEAPDRILFIGVAQAGPFLRKLWYSRLVRPQSRVKDRGQIVASARRIRLSGGERAEVAGGAGGVGAGAVAGGGGDGGGAGCVL